jgi:hypothetical protein
MENNSIIAIVIILLISIPLLIVIIISVWRFLKNEVPISSNIISSDGSTLLTNMDNGVSRFIDGTKQDIRKTDADIKWAIALLERLESNDTGVGRHLQKAIVSIGGTKFNLEQFKDGLNLSRSTNERLLTVLERMAEEYRKSDSTTKG